MTKDNPLMQIEGEILFNLDGDSSVVEEYWRREGMSDMWIRAIVEMLHDRIKKPGRRVRLSNPVYLATYLAEIEIMRWRFQNQNRRCPAKVREQIVTRIAEAAAKWHCNPAGHPLSVERILTILREPKSRRLGG